MSNLRTAAPWIAFTAGSAVADWRVGASLALAIAVAAAIGRRRSGERDDLATASLVFFVCVTAVSIADPSSAVHHDLPALAPAALGLGAAVSILRGRPFTIPYAKRSTPAELWDQPRFHHANVVISTLWAVSFIVTAAALFTLLAVGGHAGLIIEVEVAGVLVPVRLTALYRRRLRARFASVSTQAALA